MKAEDPRDKVRCLQGKLFTAAKCNRNRRFHALRDRIWRDDVLLEAWERVRTNHGAAGLLANIYLHALDEVWQRDHRHLGRLVRYADDLVVLRRTRAEGETALARVGEILTELGLKLHPDKTELVELGIGKEGFDFLACHFRVMRSHFKGKSYLFRWPSQRAMKAVRNRIRTLTARRRCSGLRDLREVVALLNPLLRGWGNYFRTGNSTRHFTSLDGYVTERLVRLVDAKHGWRRRPLHLPDWPHARFVQDFGLHKLLGTIRYPGVTHAP